MCKCNSNSYHDGASAFFDISFEKDLHLNTIEICKLDPNKAHGHDMIIFRMLKRSSNAIISALFKIFKDYLKCGIFPDGRKRGNIVLVFKKGDKQNIKESRSVSLLPICSKIFERKSVKQ